VIKNKRNFTTTALSRLIHAFVQQQILRPEYFEQNSVTRNSMPDMKAKQLMKTMLQMVESCREGI